MFKLRGADPYATKMYLQALTGTAARGSVQFEYVTEDTVGDFLNTGHVTDSTEDGRIAIDMLAVGDIVWFWSVNTTLDDQSIEDDKASGVKDVAFLRVTSNVGVEVFFAKLAFGEPGTIGVSGSPTSTQYARFIGPNTLEGRTPTQVKVDLGLGLLAVGSSAAAVPATPMTGYVGTNVQALLQEIDLKKANVGAGGGGEGGGHPYPGVTTYASIDSPLQLADDATQVQRANGLFTDNEEIRLPVNVGLGVMYYFMRDVPFDTDSFNLTVALTSGAPLINVPAGWTTAIYRGASAFLVLFLCPVNEVISGGGGGGLIDHAGSHVTGGNDKIRDGSAVQDGLMTAEYAAALDSLILGLQYEPSNY